MSDEHALGDPLWPIYQKYAATNPEPFLTYSGWLHQLARKLEADPPEKEPVPPSPPWVYARCEKCQVLWQYDSRERFGQDRPLCIDCENAALAQPQEKEPVSVNVSQGSTSGASGLVWPEPQAQVVPRCPKCGSRNVQVEWRDGEIQWARCLGTPNGEFCDANPGSGSFFRPSPRERGAKAQKQPIVFGDDDDGIRATHKLKKGKLLRSKRASDGGGK